MKLTSVLAGSAIAALALFSNIGAGVGLPQVTQAQAAVSVSFNLFYDRLADEGDWVRYQDDYVFIPAKVKRGWKPYTVGHWVYADRVGWTWASDESFGWATYHYGRWGYADDIGWYWVPGTRWAPAWVSWKRTSDYVVWAPLPPRGRRSDDVSVTVSVGDVPDYYWVAVPTKRFLEPNLRVAIIDNDVERRRIVDRADVVGTVKVENNIVVNNVINVDVIERESGRKVKRVEVRDTNDPAEAKASADQVTIFDGEVKAESDAKPKRVRDVKEAHKIRRDDAGDNTTTQTDQNTGTQTDQNAATQSDQNTGTQTDQNTGKSKDVTGNTAKKDKSTSGTANAPADTTGTGSAASTTDATQTDTGKTDTSNKTRKKANKQNGQAGESAAAPDTTTTTGQDQSAAPAAKTKAEKRRKDKAAVQTDQTTAKKKGSGADVTLPADNQTGNGADVTVPEQAQNGKSKANANRQKAQQKQEAAPDDSSGAAQAGGQKTQRKQKAAPEDSTVTDQNNSQSAGRKQKQQPDESAVQQQPDESAAQKPQRKKGKAQNCDPSDASCAQ